MSHSQYYLIQLACGQSGQSLRVWSGGPVSCIQASLPPRSYSYGSIRAAVLLGGRVGRWHAPVYQSRAQLHGRHASRLILFG